MQQLILGTGNAIKWVMVTYSTCSLCYNYCVQPCTVKQRCVLNECISNNDDLSWMSIGFIYALIRWGKRANHLRDRERVIWHSASVQSSERLFKKIEWEFLQMCCSGWQHLMMRTRDGSLQDKTLEGWQPLVLISIETHDLKITSHKCSIFLSRYVGALFLMKDIWIDDKSHISYNNIQQSLSWTGGLLYNST